MKITLIESQKKNHHRFNVYLDGKYAFGADEDTVVNFRLIKDKEIDPQTLEKILFEVEVGKLMERMYALFARRQRTEKEVRDYLRNKNYELRIKGKEQYSELVIDSLIQTLKRKGMLNDQTFARSWVDARTKSKQKGKIALKQELFQKGIKREIIDQTLEEADIDEMKLAQQALEKKLKLWKNLEPQDFRKKATEYLMRRGFSYELVREIIDKHLKLMYNTIRYEESYD